MTPLEIEVLIHCHVSPKPHPRQNAPAVQEALKKFVQLDLISLESGSSESTVVNGMIVKELKHLRVYTTMFRGKAHVKQLCNLPLPGLAFVNQSGEVIKF